MYTMRILTAQPVRLVLTVAGIALCVLLMLFLLGIYRGAYIGSVEYVRSSTADVWVVQENTTNILRGFSLLRDAHGDLLRTVPGVQSIAPALFLICSVEWESSRLTIYLTGYDPATGMGGPPLIASGRAVRTDDEIVVDRQFARKHHIHVGDTMRIRGQSLRVVGTSAGTNAFVIQFAFTTLRRAQQVCGYPGIVSCYLVTGSQEVGRAALRDRIRSDVPGIDAFTAGEFLENNIQEMENGVLPLLFAIAVIGGLVLAAILTLLLTIQILERRMDLAVMKALGVSGSWMAALVLKVSLVTAAAGSLVAILMFGPLTLLIDRLAPEIATVTSPGHVLVTLAVVAVIAVGSAALAFRRTRGIYAMEAFQ